MNALYLIPARGGSKGIANKNVKFLNGKPLIYYTIDVAREFAKDKDICVSTDSKKIQEIVKKRGLKVPFLRPSEYAGDHSPVENTIKHALEFYANQGRKYEALILLQPTSPLRRAKHLKEAISLYDNDIDMLVSVKESSSNPYFNLFEEDKNGFLTKSKQGEFKRRQDCPSVFEYNGAIYIINIDSFLTKGFRGLKRIRKYIMDSRYSIDIDDQLEWEFAEFIMQKWM